ncbi:MAG TPA: organic hydroperoxide resistance protein [Lysobacter sp.]
MNNRIDKTLYTGKTHTTGGRNGQSRSSDGRLDVALSTPGGPGAGTNPEQLLAAGWSACFLGAIGKAAAEKKVIVPAGTSLDAEIDLGQGQTGYHLQARLYVKLPGLDRDTAQALLATAHETCPYSKALRGNVDVEIHLA